MHAVAIRTSVYPPAHWAAEDIGGPLPTACIPECSGESLAEACLDLPFGAALLSRTFGVEVRKMHATAMRIVSAETRWAADARASLPDVPPFRKMRAPLLDTAALSHMLSRAMGGAVGLDVEALVRRWAEPREDGPATRSGPEYKGFGSRAVRSGPVRAPRSGLPGPPTETSNR